jgi:Flp pilus assembly protein TadD
VGTDGGAVTLWEVATGKRLASCKGHATSVYSLAFTSDGKTLATGGADRTVRLWDVLTGQERSTLSGHKGAVRKVQFSPDGSILATASNDRTVKLWRAATDSEALARRTNLDSDDPHYQIAYSAYRSAWALATSAHPQERNPARAVELAQKAVELAPTQGVFWNGLGVAHYRAGDWTAALAALENSRRLMPGQRESFNTFFLAMTHWQVGEKEKARQWYEKAVAWMEENAKDNLELQRFRIEAAGLLEFTSP